MAYTYDSERDTYIWEDDNSSEASYAGKPGESNMANNAAGLTPWWTAIDTGNSAVNEAISTAFSGMGSSDKKAIYSDEGYGQTTVEPTQEKNVFERLYDKGADGLSKAWEKDPWKVLEFLGGTVGGAYLADQKRKEADANRASRLAEQNNAAAIKKAESDAYAASFDTTRKRAPVVNKPLTRMDGSRVWGPNGKINRG